MASLFAAGVVSAVINADTLLQWALGLNNEFFVIVTGWVTYLQDNEWKTILSDSPAGVMTIPLLICGIYVATLSSFVVGKLLIRPLFRLGLIRDSENAGRLEKKEKPTWLRVLIFIAPPFPSRQPGEPPILDQKGIPFSILLHAVPPPGFGALMAVIDVLFGISGMPAWKFVLGTLIGISLHMVGLGVLYANEIEIPPPPGAVLIALLLAPMVVRTLIILIRKFGCWQVNDL